jgi:hypothetical protein
MSSDHGLSDELEDEDLPPPTRSPGTWGIVVLSLLLVAGFPLLVVLSESRLPVPNPNPSPRPSMESQDYAPSSPDPMQVSELLTRVERVTLKVAQSEAQSLMDVVATTQPARWLPDSGWYPPVVSALPSGLTKLAPDEVRAWQDVVLVVWRAKNPAPGKARGCYLALVRPGGTAPDAGGRLAGEDLRPLPLD